jgi:membrane protein
MFKFNPLSWLSSLPLYVQIIEWTKTHSFPGFGRIPIYQIIDFILDELKEDAIVTRANSMAFSFFLSIFPTLIVLFTILAYTPLYAQFSEALNSYIGTALPGNAGKMVFQTITDLATIQRGSLLSVGFVLSLWFSSNGIISMMKGFEKGHTESFIKRTGLQKRIIAVKLTFLLALVLIGSVVLIIAGNSLFNLVFGIFKLDYFVQWIIYLFRWVVMLLLLFTGITLIYREGGGIRRGLTFLNPGAVLATMLSVLTSLGFSFYVDNFHDYNKVYGSIGTLIVLLIWLQMNCFILLSGFELNASIAVNRDRRNKARIQDLGI